MATPPRIVYLKVKNYRSLKIVEMKDISPLTVVLGPNGSGKSTLFDVFGFLSECFNEGLRTAWNKRGRFKELRSREQEGDIEIMIKFRENSASPLITYELIIGEDEKGPYINSEILKWRRVRYGKPFRFLEYHQGVGFAIQGDEPDEKAKRTNQNLSSREVLAVNTLGQFADHPRVTALRDFITGWYISYLNAESARSQRESGPQEHLSKSGDNLANVIQYLKEQHSKTLEQIFERLSKWVPRLEKAEATVLPNDYLLFQIKDKPFDEPILAKYASDGTMKMLSYLVMLYAPEPPQLIGIEEPENYLHPKLLYRLAEELKRATHRSQLFVTSHSPFLLNALAPRDVWMIKRAEDGFATIERLEENELVRLQHEAGGMLGSLWMENFIEDLES